MLRFYKSIILILDYLLTVQIQAKNCLEDKPPIPLMLCYV